MNQGLVLNQKQTQKLTNNQLQYIHLIGLNVSDLEEKIKKEMDENPALVNNEPSLSEDFIGSYSNNSSNESLDKYTEKSDTNNDGDYDYDIKTHLSEDEVERKVQPIVQSSNYYEEIIDQILLMNLTDKEEKILEFLVYQLNDDGYFRKVKYNENKEIEFVVEGDQFINEVYQFLQFKFPDLDLTYDELILFLNKIKNNIEPVGLFASNLQECLLLQLKRKKSNPYIKTAIDILSKNYDEFIEMDFTKIQKKFHLTDKEDWECVMGEIKKLNPKPSVINKTVTKIIPDFKLDFDDDEQLLVSLTKGNLPQLKIDKDFKDTLKLIEKTSDDFNTIKSHVNKANSFINLINERNKTLYKVITSIVNIQKEFFLSEGDVKKLVPLNLKDVEEVSGIEMSVISRIVSSKYIETPFGTYALSLFFPQRLDKVIGKRKNVEGDYTKLEIEEKIKEIVEQNKEKSDRELTELIEKSGYQIKRRTVNKYRNELHIDNSFQRKRKLKIETN